MTLSTALAKRVALVVVVSLFAVTLAFGTATGASSHETTVGIESVSGPPGEKVDVAVWANASNVSSYQLNVTYDPRVVDVVSIDGADFDDPVTNVDEDDGWAMFTQTNVGGVDDPVLAVVTLRVQNTSAVGTETVLSIRAADTALFDSASNEIPIDRLDDGAVTVSERVTTTRETTQVTTTVETTDSAKTTAVGATQTTARPSFDVGGLLAHTSPLVLAGGAFVLGGLLVGGVFVAVSRLR